MDGLVVAGIIVALILNYIIADSFYTAAYAKGFYRRKYFWIPFFFTIVGYLLVIALPDRGEVCDDDADNENPRLEKHE